MFTLEVVIVCSQLGLTEAAIKKLQAAKLHARSAPGLRNGVLISQTLSAPPVRHALLFTAVTNILDTAGPLWSLHNLSVTAVGCFPTLASSPDTILATADVDDSEFTITYLHNKGLVCLLVETRLRSHELLKAIRAFDAALEQFVAMMAIHRNMTHIRSVEHGDIDRYLDAVDSVVLLQMPHIASLWKLLMEEPGDE